MIAAAKDKELREAIMLLPGYDPWRGAEEFYFDDTRARQYVGFIEEACCLSSGPKAGEPFALQPWQRGFTANLYGWRRKSDGYRRYREALLLIGRGNGKSEFIAANVVANGFLCPMPGAQLYSAAGKRDQTRFVFKPVKSMILWSKHMRTKAEPHLSEIRFPRDIVYKAISREAGTEHGGQVYFAAIDELHVQPDRELVDVLYTSALKLPESCLVYMTTSDFAREGSICNEKVDYGRNVRDGVIDDPTFLPAIYEAQAEDDWHDPETWRKANPNLDVSIRMEELRSLHRKACTEPGFEDTFKRLHLNIRTEQYKAWLRLEDWDKGGSRDPVAWRQTMIEELAGKAPVAALDLGATKDLTALCLLFDLDGRLIVLPYFWVSGGTAKRRQDTDRVPYMTWARQGFLKTTAGSIVGVTDFDQVASDIVTLNQHFGFRRVEKTGEPEIAVDVLFNGYPMVQDLSAAGFCVVPARQGMLSMAAPTRRLEELVLAGRIEHGGNPVLRWMASNTYIETDSAGNMKPCKKKSTGRIDGIVALVMCLARLGEPKSLPSVYETRGVITV